MADDTIFSKIARREIPATIIHETDDILAFDDIDPKAPVHVLVVPKRHIARIAEARGDDEALLGQLLLGAQQVARIKGIEESGFRIVINNGPDGSESVPHLHVHVLGGRKMGWPPG
jgi:histidine triad (HIT) family protein